MIDLVIPTYKPNDVLFHLLKSIDLQMVEVDHIYLMNTGEDLFTINLERDQISYIMNHPKVEISHVTPSEFNHGGTRNQGFQKSKADIVVTMTQDVTIISKDLIEELVKPFENPEIVVSYARQLPYKDLKPEEKFVRSFNYPKESRVKRKEDLEKLGIKTYFASNVCSAYKKEIFDQVGGFEENVIFNEDMFYAAKVINKGYAISYTAEAEVVHSHNYKNWTQFQRNFDLAISQVNHKEIFEGIRSESEGIKMVKAASKYLLSHGLFYRIPCLIATSGWKYMGYFFGKRYRRLPKKTVVKWSMNKNFWKEK